MGAVTLNIFLIIYIISITAGEDCIINNRTPENSWEQRLDQDLRCDEIIKPTINITGEINVRILFSLRYFTYDDVEEEFSIQTWVSMSWSDDRLKWNPEDYHGINTTTASLVWIPSLKLFNSNWDDFEYYTKPCTIKSDGKVVCVLRKHYYVKCRMKMGNWPYNVQKCVIGIGVLPDWLEKNLNVTLSFNSQAISLAGAKDSAEWMIIDYEQEENKNSEEQLRMIFTLKRKPSVITAMIVVPSIIITLLTIMCLFLDARNNIRLVLLGLSIVIHFQCLTEIGEYLPSNTAEPPTILLYLRGSVMFTAISALLTLFFASLCKKETTPFQWIGTFNSLILNSCARFFIWPQWGKDDIIMNSKNTVFSVEWTNFACILNRICTVVIIVVYVCLFFAFMPVPVTVEKI